MEKYSKEHRDFFNAINDLEAKDVIHIARSMRNPLKLHKKLQEHGIVKKASSELPNDINPIKLKNYLVDRYKAEWLDWFPSVINKTLGGVTEEISNKIQAIRVCLATDTPWLEWDIFENVGKSFNHQIPDFSIIQPLSLGECETTMGTMKLLRSEEEFSEEVLSYIASIAANENFIILPDDFHVGAANKILEKFTEKYISPTLRTPLDYHWGRLKDKGLLQVSFKEDSIEQRQFAKLALVKQYYKEFIQ